MTKSTVTDRPPLSMVPTKVPEGWEYITELNGLHSKDWFLEFNTTKNARQWKATTDGYDVRVVRADEIGMQWTDERGGIIPQSGYFGQITYVAIRRKKQEVAKVLATENLVKAVKTVLSKQKSKVNGRKHHV